uniref:hypothetical protein n=1 Tax=Desertihabitans aurantiacus TaxID=2282477 RepID=UPI0018E50615
VAAVAAGLARARWGVPLAAVLLAATALMKYTTATTAAVALLVLALVQLRRAVVVALLTGVVGLVVLGVQFALVPVEWTWFTELSALNSEFSAQWWCRTGESWGSCPPQSLLATMGLLSPLLLVWPAAIGVLVLRLRGAARRVALVVPAAAVLLVGAGVVVQASWYSYQLDALPVLAAGWVAWAVAASPWPGRVVLGLGTLVAAASTWWLMTPPLEVREEAPPVLEVLPRTELAYWGQVVLVVVLLVVAVGVVLAASRRTSAPQQGSAGPARQRVAVGVATAVVVLGLAGALLPSMPFSYGFQLGGYTPESEKERRQRSLEQIAEIDQRIGPDAPVVYLAFGEDSYLFDHPTYCRYAAATYLQRNLWADTEGLRGFAENLACLEDPRAEYVVVNDHWMKLERDRAQTTREAIERWFDCGRDVGTSSWRVCPRRDG